MLGKVEHKNHEVRVYFQSLYGLLASHRILSPPPIISQTIWALLFAQTDDLMLWVNFALLVMSCLGPFTCWCICEPWAVSGRWQLLLGGIVCGHCKTRICWFVCNSNIIFFNVRVTEPYRCKPIWPWPRALDPPQQRHAFLHCSALLAVGQSQLVTRLFVEVIYVTSGPQHVKASALLSAFSYACFKDLGDLVF